MFPKWLAIKLNSRGRNSKPNPSFFLEGSLLSVICNHEWKVINDFGLSSFLLRGFLFFFIFLTVFRQWKEKWIYIMSRLLATVHSFPSWLCWMENGLKLLLYKLGEKWFENTECKIKAIEVLQIPAVWRKRLLKCVILEENCFCNWQQAIYQVILAVCTLIS